MPLYGGETVSEQRIRLKNEIAENPVDKIYLQAKLNKLMAQPDLCKGNNHKWGEWEKSFFYVEDPLEYFIFIQTAIFTSRKFCKNPGCTVYEERAEDPKYIKKEEQSFEKRLRKISGKL